MCAHKRPDNVELSKSKVGCGRLALLRFPPESSPPSLEISLQLSGNTTKLLSRRHFRLLVQFGEFELETGICFGLDLLKKRDIDLIRISRQLTPQSSPAQLAALKSENSSIATTTILFTRDTKEIWSRKFTLCYNPHQKPQFISSSFEDVVSNATIRTRNVVTNILTVSAVSDQLASSS